MKTTITTQPKTTCADVGTIISTSVKATGYKLSYTWYVKDPGESSYTKSSCTSATYSCRMNAEKAGRLVYCVITNGYGDKVKTNKVRLGRTPKITVQPTTAYAKSGAVVSTTVKAVGEELTYTWYVKNYGASSYVKSSNTTATYSCKMDSTTKNRNVYCVITDRYGHKLYTNIVRLRMAATITTQPTSQTVSAGSTAKTTVKAVGDGLTYTWYIKNPGQTSYSKSKVTTNYYSCTMSSSISGRKVYCVVTDQYGKTATSNVVTLSKK